MIKILGRYTDAFKEKVKVDLWKECEKLYEDCKYEDSYIKFFKYMNDEEVQNVFYSKDNNLIKFQILQGSKEIRGYIDSERITAFALVAEFDTINVAAMRRLLEMNFALYYSRFAIKDNTVVIKLDSSIKDGSPRKLYYALKEVATRADKQDDLLVEDFASLKPVDIHKVDYSDSEKEIRHKYLKQWIESVLNRISGLNREQMSGGISYLLLDLIYKIDYFIKPEGTLMYDIEKMSWNFFSKDGLTLLQKIDNMITGLEGINKKSKDDIYKSLYKTKSTFGITPPMGFEAVLDIINANENNIKWYIDNSHNDIALSIYDYMAGYSLYSYGLAKPVRELLSIILQILNSNISKELGVKPEFIDSESNAIKEDIIKSEIIGIVEKNSETYPNINLDINKLKFSSLIDFSNSFFQMIKNMTIN